MVLRAAGCRGVFLFVFVFVFLHSACRDRPLALTGSRLPLTLPSPPQPWVSRKPPWGAVKHKLTLAAAGSVGTPRRGCAPPAPGEGAGHSKGAQPDPGLRLPAPMPLSSLAARPGTMPWPLAGSSAGLGTASAVRALQPAAGPGPRPLVVPTPSAKPC